MKNIVLNVLFALFVCRSGMAANIQWDSMTLRTDAIGGYGITYPFVTMTATVVGDYITLWADPYDYMELSSSWIVAQRGDVVTVDSVRQSSSHFYSADFWTGDEGDVRTDYPIVLKDGSSAYLAIISRTYANPTDYDTAWAELRYCNGSLYINSSAIDYDGGALEIGAIPEPSSALLVLLGCSVLLLNRRRKFGA